MVNTCAMVLLWRWPDGLLFMSVVELNPCGIASIKYFPVNFPNKFKIIINTFILFRAPV